MNNYIFINGCDVITHVCPVFIGGLGPWGHGMVAKLHPTYLHADVVTVNNKLDIMS